MPEDRDHAGRPSRASEDVLPQKVTGGRVISAQPIQAKYCHLQGQGMGSLSDLLYLHWDARLMGTPMPQPFQPCFWACQPPVHLTIKPEGILQMPVPGEHCFLLFSGSLPPSQD